MPAPRFLMPAEWEPHEATWLAFPHNVRDWPGKFAPIPWVYAEIIRAIAPGERVNLLVDDATHEQKAREVLRRSTVDTANVVFRRFPTNRVWTRDYGPIFVRKAGSPKLTIARFRFNAWAKYDDWKRDDRVPLRAAKALGLSARTIVHRGARGQAPREVVLEGGAIDVNGRGTLLTTEECLLDPKVQVRNPGFGPSDWETVFGDALGIRQTIWLGKGIAGDDTHGHVDDLARFVGPRTIVLAQEPDGRDVNHRPLGENRERLASARLADGTRPEVVPLPMPHPVIFEGTRLPASYANFYIANHAVVVPIFGDPRDREALGILAEVFTDRPVVGVYARDLVWGLGTIHCLSQQQPAPRAKGAGR